MKKTLSTIVLASALLLGTVAPVAANAAAVDGTSGHTTTSAKFTKPEDQTAPVDPTDPTKPVTTDPDSGDHGGATTNGDLTFLYVSPKIDFGSNATETTTAGAKAQVIKADSITTQAFGTGTPNADFVTEVADTRGSNAGWQVKASATPLTSGSNALNGAVINLNAKTQPVASIVNSASSTVTGANAAVATDGSTTTVYSAAAGQGAGTTAMSLSKDNITLSSLPANIAEGTYAGTLNWTLDNTPTD